MAFSDVYKDVNSGKKAAAKDEGQEGNTAGITKGKAEWMEDFREELSSLQAMAEDGVFNITSDPDAYREFLVLMSHNPGLEVSAAAQVMGQVSDAGTVKTLDDWNSAGRRVNKGEKGFRIISGIQKISTLFDISQTMGDELVQPQLKEKTAKMQTALSGLLDCSPVEAIVNRDIDCVARYNPVKCVIEVNPQNGEYAAFKALCREIVHASYHKELGIDYDREIFSLDAESAAYIMASRFGVPVDLPDFREVAGHYVNTSQKSRLASLNMVQELSEEMYGAVKEAAFPAMGKNKAPEKRALKGQSR